MAVTPRRRFLETAVLAGAGLTVGAPRVAGAIAQGPGRPGRRLIMAGYAPLTTSFSRGLDLIAERLTARFGDAIEPHRIYNISDVGYAGAGDLLWLVDSGVLTLAYATMSTGVPELEVAALPFLFPSTGAARAVMDGPLGERARQKIEADTNYRVLGFFENGFRHLSNDVRPVRSPADMAGLSVRVLAIQARTFALLGARPVTMDLAATIPLLADGTIDGQENPYENTVSYGPYRHQRYHTATFHSYLSRPIFVHRPTFDAWPGDLQAGLRAIVRDAVIHQRRLHEEAEVESQAVIRAAGGEIVELTPAEHAEFVAAVAPIYADARTRYSRDLLALVGL